MTVTGDELQPEPLLSLSDSCRSVGTSPAKSRPLLRVGGLGEYQLERRRHYWSEGGSDRIRLRRGPEKMRRQSSSQAGFSAPCFHSVRTVNFFRR